MRSRACIAILIVGLAGCRSHTPGAAPKVTSRAGAPQTVPERTTATTVPPAPDPATNEDIAARAWIAQHHGRVLPVGRAVQIGALADAAYALIGTPDGHLAGLERVALATGRITASTRFAATDGELVVGDGAVYLSTADIDADGTVTRNELSRLDPVDLLPRWTVAAPGEIVVGDGAIWSVDGDRLVRLDPRTGATVRAVALPRAVADLGPTLAFDHARDELWMTYGGDPAATIEVRGARAATLDARVTVPSVAVGTGVLTPTADGVWLSFRSGMNGSATGYALPSLHASAQLADGYTMGVSLTWNRGPLWIGGVDFIACADARTGRNVDPPRPIDSEPLAQGPWPELSSPAFAGAAVVVAVGGRLATFAVRDLCPHLPR